jgi:hypothetical protein
MSGCSLGMLLFYRDSKTRTVYKSSESKQNYYIVNATTLSHCGCTDLHIDSYKNGKKEFNLFYNGNIARKTIYKFDSNANQRDTIRLVATPNNNYTTPFDSLDIEIFNRIDSIAIQKPTGIVYEIKRPAYKGFISDPYYSQREL